MPIQLLDTGNGNRTISARYTVSTQTAIEENTPFRGDERIFSGIYKNKTWYNGTSGSGSLLETTPIYRQFLQVFLLRNNIRSVVDFGCGDWMFSQHINWKDIRYYGYDIVGELMARNTLQFGSPLISFEKTPEDLNELPTADLYIIKDVLIHMSNERVRYLLDVIRTKYQFALITNDVNVDETNMNITTGHFRPIDIRKAPFYADAASVLSYVYTFNNRNVWKEALLLFNGSPQKSTEEYRKKS